MSNIVFWIWFAEKTRLRAATKRLLLQRFDGPKEIFYADERDISGVAGISADEIDSLMDKSTRHAEKTVSRCAEENVDILTIQDAAYPERLRNIPEPPYVLYINGHLPAVDTEAAVAVVGTRKATPYGDKMARTIGFGVARCGGIVVTGLAEGIDSRAAEGALMAQGRVIGVLGTAINEVFPRFNQRLFDDVQASGALVSEYPPDAEGSRNNFPLRNRIIAGLSLGTVVVEAPLKSGSLITARRALDYGRDVFAVPANADSPNARGSNALLREGAMIAENGWDVMCCYENMFPEKVFKEGRDSIPEEMAQPVAAKPQRAEIKSKKKSEKPEKPPAGFLKLRLPVKGRENAPENLEKQLEGLTEKQLKIVGVMSRPSMHVDDIIDLTSLPAATVLSELTILQIKGFVAQESGKRFTLKINKRG